MTFLYIPNVYLQSTCRSNPCAPVPEKRLCHIMNNMNNRCSVCPANSCMYAEQRCVTFTQHKLCRPSKHIFYCQNNWHIWNAAKKGLCFQNKVDFNTVNKGINKSFGMSSSLSTRTIKPQKRLRSSVGLVSALVGTSRLPLVKENLVQ